MKTGNMGLNSKVLGSLRKVAAFALISVIALGGTAYAQVTLGDVTIAIDDEVSSTFDVQITIDRDDATADPDSDVTALGGELTLPAGFKLSLDADNSCDALASDNQTQGVNASVQFKRSATTFLDPPDNTQCTPVPETGDVLEFFWLEVGSSDPLPVSFPVVLDLTIEATSGGAFSMDLTTKYRVGDGAEETTDAPTENFTVITDGCTTVAGDADGSGGVDPADAQLAFEAFLQIPAALDALDADCGNFCDPDGSGVDPADAQGIFNAFLQLSDPCG